jgi:hypothetical protein
MHTYYSICIVVRVILLWLIIQMLKCIRLIEWTATMYTKWIEQQTYSYSSTESVSRILNTLLNKWILNAFDISISSSWSRSSPNLINCYSCLLIFDLFSISMEWILWTLRYSWEAAAKVKKEEKTDLKCNYCGYIVLLFMSIFPYDQLCISDRFNIFFWPVRFNGSMLSNRRFNRFKTVEPVNHWTEDLTGSMTGPVLITMVLCGSCEAEESPNGTVSLGLTRWHE